MTADDGFRVLDAAHGDWSDTTFPAAEPGHVIRHAGRTALFADGTGEVTTFDPRRLADGTPPTASYTTAAPHHGAAVELPDGGLIVTLGTTETRTGIAILDRDHRERARNEDCPGVHGESTVQGDTVVFGCQNGALLVGPDRAITKIASPTPYGRIGTQAAGPTSPIALGDYKQDEDAELERPHQVSLIDTRTHTLRLADIGTSYSSHSLARGPHGEALILGTDGGLHVLDPTTGTRQRTIPVTAPWEEPLQSQKPRPTLFARGTDAYVSDPATRTIHRVDLTTGTIAATVTLPDVPNELSGVDAE